MIDLTYLTAEKEESQKPTTSGVKIIEKKIVIDGEEVSMNEVEYEKPLEALISLASIFLEARDELNLTAAHYVLEIFTSLLKSNQSRVDFMQWLFSDSSYTQYLTRHAGETCVIDFIKKVLNMPQSDENADISDKFLYHKLILMHSLVAELLASDNYYFISSVSELFLDLIRESSSILDGVYFVEKVFLNEERFS